MRHGRNGDAGFSQRGPTVYTMPRNVAWGLVVFLLFVALSSAAHAVTLEIRVQELETENEVLRPQIDIMRDQMKAIQERRASR